MGEHVVYKWVVPVQDSDVKLMLPRSAQVIHVAGESVDVVTMWTLQDVDDPLEPRWFRVFGTGHKISLGYRYVGTTLVGPFVWHLFEKADR